MSKTKTKGKHSTAEPAMPGNNALKTTKETEVLTLAEAAAYLRVTPEIVVSLIQHHGLPARRVEADWRFLKSALQDWLRVPAAFCTKEAFWQTHFGALKHDPYLKELVDDIYRKRAESGNDQ